MSDLTDSVLEKYPGAYDHLDPADLEKAIIDKYPGAYDHLVEHYNPEPEQTAQDSGGLLDRAIKFLKDPANVPVQMLKGFGEGAVEGIKGMADTSMRALTMPILPERPGLGEDSIFKKAIPGTNTSLSEIYDEIQPQSSLMNAIPFLMEGAKGTRELPQQEMAPQEAPVGDLPKVNLPPEFTAVGEEPQITRPKIDSEQKIYDLARNRFGMGQDLPSLNEARQGLMSEMGGLGSGGKPPTDQGFGESPLKSHFRQDNETGAFIPIDETGKQTGPALSPEGESLRKDLQEYINKDIHKHVPGSTVGDDTDFLTKTSNTFAKTTRSVLGTHIPGTAFSMHGVNEVARHTLFGGDQSFTGMPGRAVEGLYQLINPRFANRALEQAPMMDMANAVNKHGLQMDISDVDIPSIFKGNNPATKAFNFITDPTPLFRQVIPNLKFKTYQNVMKNLVSKGISEDSAGKTAADYANTVYGGVTPSGLRADPTFTKLSRIAMLAPDWMTTNYRLGAGTAQALKNPMDPRSQMYIKGMTNFIAAYGAANVVNKLNTGHYMWQNEPGKELAVAMGGTETPEGKQQTRYLNPFGTAMDFVRIPLAIAHSSLSGPSSGFKESMQLMKNRASEPLQILGSLAFNQDYSGRPLYGKTNFGRKTISEGDAALNVGKEVSSHLLPIGIEGLIDRMQGKIGDEEAAAKFFQVPLEYKKPAKGYR